jgi:hypothetical protein
VTVSLKDIVADHLDGPHDPASGGHFDRFPKLDPALDRWIFAVIARPHR